MTPEELSELIDEHFGEDEDLEEDNADDDEEEDENPWAGRPATVVGMVPWWDKEA